MFDTPVIDAIKAHARQAYPAESCGVVVDGVYHPQQNLAEDPTRAFEMDLQLIARLGDRLQAVVHSHPDGPASPSAADMAQQIAMARPWGLVYVTASDVSEPVFWGDQVPAVPLLGRSFLHGVWDCYSLVRDWYRQERQVVLRDFPRDDEWWHQGGNLYLENFRKAGFEPVDMAGLETGDVVIFQVASKVPNHAGVYLGDGTIIHHLYNRLSVREPIYRWMRYARIAVRYAP